MQALINAGRLNDAEKMMEGIDNTWNEHLLLANAYMKGGKKERAESHIQKAISMAGDDPDAAAHIQGWAAHIYIDGQEFEKAYNAASSIPRPLGRLQALLRLAETLHNAGNTRKSDELYAEAIQIMSGGKESDKSSDAGTACSFVAQSYGRSGNVEKVVSTVSTYCPEKVRAAVSYGYAINELAKRGDVDGALRVQSRLDVIWKNDADGPIAAALARKGEYESAATKARGILNEAIRSNAVRRMAALTPPPKTIVSWLQDTKTFKRDDNRAAAVQVLTAALARSSNATEGIRWLESQPPDLVKARGYLGVAQGLLGVVPGTGSPGD
jgi:tetratricopeptide (TPR) repeat protein